MRRLRRRHGHALPRGRMAQGHEVKVGDTSLWLTYHGPGKYVVDVYRGGFRGTARGRTPEAAVEAGKAMA